MKKIIAGLGALAMVLAFGVAFADEMPSFNVNNNTAYKIYLEHSKAHSKDMGISEAKGSGAGGVGPGTAAKKEKAGTWKFFDSIVKLPAEIDTL